MTSQIHPVPPEPSPPQVVVTPIPPEESTTLRLNKRWAIWTWIGATALTILDLILQALGDPILAPLIAEYMPPLARAILVGVVTLLTRQNWNKRMNTAQPIIGSPAEEKTMRLVGVALVCLLATGCASTRTAAYEHDRPTEFEECIWLGFEAYTRFLDRLFPARAQPEHGGECLGIVWTGSGYRCSESGAKDAGDGQPRQPTKKENE